MWTILLAFFAILRLIVPFYLFANPVLVTFFYVFILDNFDGYIAYRANFNRRRYNSYDKLLDYWWYIFIVFFMRGTPLFEIFLVLFLARGIAQLVSIVSGNEKIFIFFPGVIEVYFIGYVLTLVFPSLAFLYVGTNQIVPFSISLIISLIREYIIHVRKISVAKLLLGFGPEWKF